MADPKGFLKYDRQEVGRRPVTQRKGDYNEVNLPHDEETLYRQTARCMDCGIPFCMGAGCPLYNRIPEINDLVYQKRWREAAEVLHSTNNFPEITGRICPALCEAACTLNLDQSPVLIEHIEYQIVERAWEQGWIKPQIPDARSGKRVAVAGSGPAGLAAAQQLARYGHDVTVFEMADRIGGLLRYGIPDFKMEKQVIDRRLDQMRAEGVRFETEVKIGEDLSAKYLRKTFDAVCLAMGAGTPRNLAVAGRELNGVHFAMDFLSQQNRSSAGDEIASGCRIEAQDKVVAVVGGGDTGSDCVGTANRQGAKAVYQFEILPQPPEGTNPETPWPHWPVIMRVSSSHQEGCIRRWSVLTKSLTGDDDSVQQLHACEVEWYRDDQGQQQFREVAGTDFSMQVDLVLLAMGFLHVEHAGIVDDLGVALDARGNVTTGEDYLTSVPGVFACGDTVRGASLVVHAINQGRCCATGIDRWLKKS